MKSPTLLTATVYLLCLSSCSKAALALGTRSSNTPDEAALRSFQSMISGDPLTALASWGNNSLHYCQWTGVACNNRHHPYRVTSLNLNLLDLVGSISPSLANLTYLKTIALSNNQLTGSIPPELGRLRRLQTLILSNNSLTGDIPTNISRCVSLQNLDLSSNMLVGTIPPELGSLPNLLRLRLYTNNFTGSIPAFIGNISSLLSLDLSENSLEGEIPNTLEKLANLGFLQLSINRLSGMLSPSLCNFSFIYYFDVGDNMLYGDLPLNIGSNLPRLMKLYLYWNQFRGSIPASLSNASKLERIGFEQNQFKGIVPSELGRIKGLSWLALGSNELVAQKDSDWEFLVALTNCSNLQILEFSDNLFGGLLPSSIGNLSTQLLWLSMEDNRIAGSIPEEMGKYINLTVLLMHNNLLTGSIPTSIGNIQRLHRLKLTGNQLSGMIPSSLGNLTQLNELNLGGNKLEGSIPVSLGKLQNLNLLNLSCNQLDGTIPKEVVSLSSLSKYIDISHNSLIGPLPLEVGRLKNLLAFNLSENQLSGKIPSNLGQCQLLGYLRMEGNSFEGTIPLSLSNLKGLQELDLSLNNLSGEIPVFLENLQFLQYLNLSYNDFKGQVPKEGIFRNLSASLVVGNSKLCSNSQNLHLQSCVVEATGKGHISPTVKVVIIAASIVVFLFVLLILFGFFYSRQRMRKILLDIDHHSNISYAELAKATNGFSPSNLIGEGSFGSVYRGIMEHYRRIVAVKVLNLQYQGAQRSFLSECEALRNVRHRNLVKILTTCATLDPQGNTFKALVFEFMQNGSLENWLHPETGGSNKLRKLSFIQMLNIAIDVASALDYLHHHVQTPIVHCDIKPSNVLLDIDMVAHVSDFGLARFLYKTTAYSSSEKSLKSISLKGSIGYVAPEYGMGGQVSTNADVYSYGILLLEMFTGKRPTDQTFMDGFNLRKFVETFFPVRLVDIINPQLILEEEIFKDNRDDIEKDNARDILKECLVKIIWIALSCSEESPRKRYNMGTVVKDLLEARDYFLAKYLSLEKKITFLERKAQKKD